MDNCYGIILTTSEESRMKSKLPAALHRICGRTMLERAVDSLKAIEISEYKVFIDYKNEIIKEQLDKDVSVIFHKEQSCTENEMLYLIDFLQGKIGTVIIIPVDAPLINPNIISKAMKYHNSNGLAVTILSTEVNEPNKLDRIIRDDNNNFKKIIKYKDTADKESIINEVNSSIYCFDIPTLSKILKSSNSHVLNGYSITQIINNLINTEHKIGIYKVEFNDIMEIESEDEIYNDTYNNISNRIRSSFVKIDSEIKLCEVNQIFRRKIVSKLMNEGVNIIEPSSTYIDYGVKVGCDTIIYPGTIIEGNTTIGEDCIIGPNSKIIDSTIENGVEIQSSVVLKSKVQKNAAVGPFAYIRPDSCIGEKVKIGDFVEIKKSSIGDGTKVSHLTYIGDSEVGKGCNFGCGTVVVNYDGTNKNKTIIGDNAFIGCNTNLVSPVEVGDNAYIAAGSTITDYVPDGALAVARARQVNKEGWVQKKGIWKITDKSNK